MATSKKSSSSFDGEAMSARVAVCWAQMLQRTSTTQSQASPSHKTVSDGLLAELDEPEGYVDEMGGVGQTVVSRDSAKAVERLAEDKLRSQLLGKSHPSRNSSSEKGKKDAIVKRPRGVQERIDIARLTSERKEVDGQRTDAADAKEEIYNHDDSRSSAIKSKRSRPKKTPTLPTTTAGSADRGDDQPADGDASAVAVPSAKAKSDRRARSRPSSLLDDLLAERAAKRMKQSRK